MSRETANAARYAKGLRLLGELEGDLLDALDASQKYFNDVVSGNDTKSQSDKTQHLINKACAKAHGNP